jgi:hypothetical protein
LRIRQNDNLARVRRVSEDFLIAGDGRVEDNFTGPFDRRTKTLALEDGAVFQGEDCRVRQGWFLQIGGNFYLNIRGGAMQSRA